MFCINKYFFLPSENIFKLLEKRKKFLLGQQHESLYTGLRNTWYSTFVIEDTKLSLEPVFLLAGIRTVNYFKLFFQTYF